MFGRRIIWRCRCQLLREGRASHPARSVESLEQFPLLSCAAPQIVKFILCAQPERRHKIDPQTKSSSTRNKTLLKLMNHLVSRTRSYTPASSSAAGGGGGGGGSYGRMTRRGSLSCPSLVQGEPSLLTLSIIEMIKIIFKELGKLDRSSAVVFQSPNIGSCLVSLDCAVRCEVCGVVLSGWWTPDVRFCLGISVPVNILCCLHFCPIVASIVTGSETLGEAKCHQLEQVWRIYRAWLP